MKKQSVGIHRQLRNVKPSEVIWTGDKVDKRKKRIVRDHSSIFNCRPGDLLSVGLQKVMKGHKKKGGQVMYIHVMNIIVVSSQ